MNEIVDSIFEKETMLFTYYRYLDKFHCIPRDFTDLFDFVRYTEADSKINSLIQRESSRKG